MDVDHSHPELRRPVVARGADYEAGDVVPEHVHARAQLLYGSTGVVMVETSQGAWMMPPQRGLWIPAGVTHSVRMLGRVRMRSLYFTPRAVRAMPAACEVLGMTPLMRNLLAEAVTLPAEYDVAGRDGMVMALIQQELPRLPILPLSLPLPEDPALAARCRAFLAGPRPRDRIDDWARAVGMSRRSFTRHFRAETGLSFVAWRQQACIMAALPRLAAGEPVTSVALDLGYANPAAFSAMFTRSLGAPPRSYREMGGA
ncbi:AraC family transcriptional regulator [Acidimangrovimonas sediminis]|uniref:AraC family transcriptional regulator n=1 Tax=Acidimangrovimonas sediminis TaxID=2056283 RepID=UPI001E428FD7|nr:helix-turn-helix transcriptional regulator [Acidimangrovimonas sediminis]